MIFALYTVNIPLRLRSWMTKSFSPDGIHHRRHRGQRRRNDEGAAKVEAASRRFWTAPNIFTARNAENPRRSISVILALYAVNIPLRPRTWMTKSFSPDGFNHGGHGGHRVQSLPSLCASVFKSLAFRQKGTKGMEDRTGSHAEAQATQRPDGIESRMRYVIPAHATRHLLRVTSSRLAPQSFNRITQWVG